MKRIGICYAEFEGREYVYREAKKWEKVLLELGFEVFFQELSQKVSKKIGNPWENILEGRIDNERIERSNKITQEICREFIEENRLDALIVEDLFSTIYGLFFAEGITSSTKETDISLFAHHHTFWWDEEIPQARSIKRIANKYLPPRDPRICHIVLNTIYFDTLLKQKGIRPYIVPYMFDFAMVSNVSFSQDEEFLIFCPNIPGIKKDMAEKVVNTLRDCGFWGGKLKLVVSSSLDVLFSSRLLLYPAVFQGWGPYILEAVAGGIPIAVSNYKVYKRDISHFEFDFISLGDMKEEELAETSRRIVELFSNPEKIESVRRHNIEIVEKCFSLSMLKKYLNAIFLSL